MKWSRIASVALFGAVLSTITGGPPALAQNYPWCAYYGGGIDGGGTNCGFISYEQCMVTLSGIGGFCDRNTLYVPPPGPHPSRSPRRRHRRH